MLVDRTFEPATPARVVRWGLDDARPGTRMEAVRCSMAMRRKVVRLVGDLATSPIGLAEQGIGGRQLDFRDDQACVVAFEDIDFPEEARVP